MGDGRILVLGGSGFIGRHVLEFWGTERCVGTYCDTPFDGGQKFDVLHHDLTDLAVDLSEFSHAVVLLGNTSPDWCQQNPAGSQELNVNRIIYLMDQLFSNVIQPIFCSTEAVFDGRRGGYVETDPPSPILVYGRQKVEVENHLSNSDQPSVVVRIAKVYDRSLDRDSFLGGWYHDILDDSSDIRCADDFLSCPILVEDVVKSIAAIVDQNLAGTFHLAGPNVLSRFDVCKIIADEVSRFKSFSHTIERCSIDDFPTAEPRPKDISMNAAKIRTDASIQFQGLASVCQQLVEAELGS